MQAHILIDENWLGHILKRLCYQIIENHDDFEHTVLLGLQPRGVFLAEKIVAMLKELKPDSNIHYGVLDPTFHRDDFRLPGKQLIAHQTTVPVSLDHKKVVLIDDVLYTGRTIRAGLESMLEHGRPQQVELLVLIDRRFSRQLPIEPNYVGKSIDSYDDQKVKVMWRRDGGKADQVLLVKEEAP